MKTTAKYIFSSLLAAGLMAACSPEEFEGLDESGIPAASQYLIDVKLDQTINQVELALVDASTRQPVKGIYPVWQIEKPDGKLDKSTNTGYTNIYAKSGDYHVTAKVGNRNGISDGTLTADFHFDNSIVDFSKYIGMISKGEWHFANKEKGHLACGPDGNDPVSWWSASADEKADFGLYDNTLTFADDMTYHFEPGEHGTIYANKGVTVWPDYRDENNDYNVPVEPQNSEYAFDTDGDDIVLTFPQGTYFPYIADDAAWNQPRYKVVSLSTKKMTLVCNLAGISWQYILTTENTVEHAFNGFTYDQPNNIWKNVQVEAGGIYYADAGWAPYPDNGGATFNVTNQETTVTLPMATASQWQAQFPIVTNIGPGSSNMTSAKHYDFSCVISSSKDLNGVTFKLVETGDNGVPGSLGIAYDANAVFYDNSTNLKAFEDYVFYLVDQPGVDIQDHLLQLVLDFGGCAEGTEVTIKNIVLIEHDLNTELGLLPTPGDEGGEDGPSAGGVVWDPTENLLADMNVDLGYYYAPGWAQIADPVLERDGNAFTWTLPAATSERWQAQHTFHNIGVAAAASESYDIRLKVFSTTDIPGLTVKFTEEANDNVFLTEDRHDITAFEEKWIEIIDVRPYNATTKEYDTDITNLKIVIDAGGNPENTVFTVSDMHMQLHKAAEGGSGAAFDYNSESNLWRTATLSNAGIYYAPNWAQIGDFDYTITNQLISVTLPEATFGEWQAQLPVLTNLDKTIISADKKYDFHCIISSSVEHPGMTLKLVEEGPNNTPGSLGINYDANAIFYQPGITLPAFDEVEVSLYGLQGVALQDNPLKLVIDFGFNAANTSIEISDIVLREAE